jgi:mRNA-degrading endonuclease toxin of MazEF toxin-antitoxin module
MLSDNDLEKLSYGRIVLVGGVLDSFGNKPVGPHFAVILDDDVEIRKHGNMMLVMISTNDQIDNRFLVPVPARTGLKGNIVCSWRPKEPVELTAILQVHHNTLNDFEMTAVQKMILKHRSFTRS